jgi:hypothetical protein
LESSTVHCGVFCGIDWAEDHHDVALVDARGVVLSRLRIADNVAGFTQLLALLAAHGDSATSVIPVAIETPRGLPVAWLRAGGRQVFAINPLSVARYRERHSVARKKSDKIDAATLANILRTDMTHTDRYRPTASLPKLWRAGPCPARRGMGPHPGPQQAAQRAARVLPGDPGRVRQQTRWHPATRGPGDPRRRFDANRRGQANQDPAAGAAAPCRPQTGRRR